MSFQRRARLDYKLTRRLFARPSRSLKGGWDRTSHLTVVSSHESGGMTTKPQENPTANILNRYKQAFGPTHSVCKKTVYSLPWGCCFFGLSQQRKLFCQRLYGIRHTGWWEYDPRANDDLEAAFLAGESKVELLIAGYVYLVDLHGMMQYRKTDPGRRRAVKRDKVGTACKGVAGIRPTVLQAVGERSRTQSQSSDTGRALVEALNGLTLDDEDIDLIHYHAVADDDDDEDGTPAYSDDDDEGYD